MTKREMFALISSICSDNDEIVAFCAHETELLDRKAGSKSPTKAQVENVAYKADIVAVLESAESPLTVSEIMALLPTPLSNQRVTALIGQLKRDGKVDRSEVKGKAYFALAD